MRKILPLVWFLLFYHHSSAQLLADTAVLRQIIISSSDDSSRMDAHLSFGRYYIDNNNDSSLFHAQKAYLLALKQKSVYYEAQCLDFMGAVLLRRGNTDQALDFLLRALKLFQTLKDSAYLIVTNRNIAGVYKSQSDVQRARQHYFIGLQIRPKAAYDSLFHSWVLMELGDLYLRMNMPDSALYYAHQAYEVSMKLPIHYSKKYLPFALNTIGRIYQRTQDYGKAMEQYQLAVQTAVENQNLQAAGDNYMAIAFLYKETGRMDSAFLYAKRALGIAREVNNPLSVEIASGLLKNYYKERNQLDSAFVYAEIRGKAKDSLLSLEKIRQVQNLSFNEQIQQQKVVATQLEYKNKIRLYTLLSGVAVLALLAVVLYRGNRHKQKANAQLQRQKQITEKAYEQLKATQAQLIQQEKMASLGELTAGIAHEIQNPLNFVNNFADISKELVEELKQEAEQGKTTELKTLADEVLSNLDKVVHHGKRADNIVRGMLQHSRSATGERELTDLNVLVEQYLQLAYHGYRAKDKGFSTDLSTHYDSTIDRVNLVPQEIGRVLLNLFNNAFYAVCVKKQQLNGTFEPVVSVSTRKEGNQVVITVRDNGTGMSPRVVDKVFQPFFTTKPTGEGTGLGLSLSYDIITKGHGGSLSVQSSEGEGSEFIVNFPTT
jgi:signal transduction histidine kinase